MVQTLRSFILHFVVLTVLVSCGDNSNKTRDIRSGISGKEIVLKFGDIYRTYSIDELHSVTITVKSMLPNTRADLTKTFADTKMVEVLTMLGLHAPSEPGAASAIVTGTIVVRFKLESLPDRKLHILNGRLIEDASYVEAYYHPAQILDTAWLEKQ